MSLCAVDIKKFFCKKLKHLVEVEALIHKLCLCRIYFLSLYNTVNKGEHVFCTCSNSLLQVLIMFFFF